MTLQKLFIILIAFSTSMLNAQTTDLTSDNSEVSVLTTNITDLNQEDKVDTNFDDLVKMYEGKVIYLDFWASWCGPCKKEMPHAVKLQEEFKGKDVAFVYISTDRDKTAWMNAIEKYQVTGEHYRVNKNVYTQMNEKFNVQYIPRYVLIDKEGNVVNDKANRPSNAAIVSDINALL